MNVYTENSQMRSIKKLPEIINGFSEIIEYKINIQNQLYFYILTINNYKMKNL